MPRIGDAAQRRIGRLEPFAALHRPFIVSLSEGTLPLAAEAGLRGAVAGGITAAAKAGWLGPQAAKNLSPPLVGTLTYLTFEGVKDYRRLRRGELTGEGFADGMMQKSVSATAGVYGAAVGQALIPVPLVGAMIGAAVGSLIAQNGYRSLDSTAEAHFRTAELAELARAYQALTAEWNAMLGSYDRWVASSTFYRAERDRYLRIHADRAPVQAEADLLLRRALSDDGW